MRLGKKMIIDWNSWQNSGGENEREKNTSIESSIYMTNEAILAIETNEQSAEAKTLLILEIYASVGHSLDFICLLAKGGNVDHHFYGQKKRLKMFLI